jgi:exosortase
MTFPLRRWASSAAAATLPVLIPGLYTEAQAVVIDYIMPGRPPGTLNVEEACSGMRLMMAFVTLGVAMAYLGDRPLWQRIVMIACCVPIAVVCNTLRVTATGVIFILGDKPTPWLDWLGVSHLGDLAKGTPHQALGILMLGVAFGLYALIGYVLKHLFIEEKDEPQAQSA